MCLLKYVYVKNNTNHTVIVYCATVTVLKPLILQKQ